MNYLETAPRAKTHTSGFCRCDALGLPLPYGVAFVLSDERQHLKHKVGNEGFEKVFVAASVKQGHIENQNIDLFLPCKNLPLFLNLFVIAP